jgi:hypothetical protein
MVLTKTHDKAKDYLSKIFTNTESEKRLYNLAKKFVIKHFKTNDPSWVNWVGEAIHSATIDISRSTTTKTKSEVIKKITENFVVKFIEKLGGLIMFRSKTTSENARKFVSQKNGSIKTGSVSVATQHKEQYEKAEKYLKTQLGSDEKVKELLEKTDTIVIEHATKKVIKEKADQVIVEEIQETVTEEEITEIIEVQNKEGSYEKISDRITEKLGIITTEDISYY